MEHISCSKENTMKKLNIYMSRLKYGGMELSLINFINYSNICNNYKVELYLTYVINMELLQKINNKVKVHILCKGKWNLINKIITAVKFCIMCIKTPKSDISICYSNHQRILSILSRKSTHKSILFVHSDLDRYIDKKSRIKLKNKIKFNKFTKIICVSQKVKESILKLYDKEIEKKCYVVHNYVDGERIIRLSNEKIKEKIDFNIPTFISIANHVEEYKNINLIIDSAHKLKQENITFQVLLIGSGKDTNNYEKRIKELGLDKNIIILGTKENPYPYLKMSKALLFTSKYEGYGMVLDEARVLNIPIISTGSGASYEICNEGYGVVTEEIAKEMKFFIKNNQHSKDFDYHKHNREITKKLDEIIKYEEK